MAKAQHPSGRPIRQRAYRELSIHRYPPDEPLTPGLRRSRNVQAIGFHVRGNDYEDETCRKQK